jgi:hypothetical protein
MLPRLCAFALLSTGCIMGAGYSTRDRITMAARDYNDAVRWGRHDLAAQHVPAEHQASFVARHKALEDDLEIADYEIAGIEIDKSDRKRDRATAHVEYTWSLKTQGLVHSTSTTQQWEERDGRWVLQHEIRTKGTPLTLFEEPSARHE